jgi:hypothetical protein
LLPEQAEELEAYMEQHPKFIFICKPNCGKGGEGIFLVEKFKQIPKNLWQDCHSDLLVQRYIKTPILIDKKKFDLRIYVMIKGIEPLEAYICDEGLGRFCTENYQMPYAGNMKNMYMHLTNYSLNKNRITLLAMVSSSSKKAETKVASVFYQQFGKLSRKKAMMLTRYTAKLRRRLRNALKHLSHILKTTIRSILAGPSRTAKYFKSLV